MGFVYIVYCDVCGEKIKTHDRKLMNTKVTCEECRTSGFSIEPLKQEIPLQQENDAKQKREPKKAKEPKEKPKKDEVFSHGFPQHFPHKIPVIAENMSEYVRWLVRNRYSRKDYEFLEINVMISAVKSRIFVVLPNAVQRVDWSRISRYFLETEPTLIVE